MDRILSSPIIEESKLKTRIGSIVIRCFEFEKMMAFWQAALGYRPRGPIDDGFVVLTDPEGKGPNLSLDQAPARRAGKRVSFVFRVAASAARRKD
jgi:hypothetical protein